MTAATRQEFLSTSGRAFERSLLLSQLTPLHEEQHIAKVMIDLETTDERRTFWRGVEQRFTELRAEVEGLLEQQYFCG